MKKDQIDFVVKYVLVRIGSCNHALYSDCNRCIGKWIRKGIRKVEAEK